MPVKSFTVRLIFRGYDFCLVYRITDVMIYKIIMEWVYG